MSQHFIPGDNVFQQLPQSRFCSSMPLGEKKPQDGVTTLFSLLLFFATRSHTHTHTLCMNIYCSIFYSCLLEWHPGVVKNNCLTVSTGILSKDFFLGWNHNSTLVLSSLGGNHMCYQAFAHLIIFRSCVSFTTCPPWQVILLPSVKSRFGDFNFLFMMRMKRQGMILRKTDAPPVG